jgi:hypothetical protein
MQNRHLQVPVFLPDALFGLSDLPTKSVLVITFGNIEKYGLLPGKISSAPIFFSFNFKKV